MNNLTQTDIESKAGISERQLRRYDTHQGADQSKEQLALALRAESVEDFDAIWKFCHDHKIEADTAIGMDHWPSIGYVPATTDYVLNKLNQRTGRY